MSNVDEFESENNDSRNDAGMPFDFEDGNGGGTSAEGERHHEEEGKKDDFDPREELPVPPDTGMSAAPVPQKSDASSGHRNQNYPRNQNQKKGKGDEFRSTVSNYAVSMYEYAAQVKKTGHSSLADLMFRDLMKIIMATNTASEAIGREKFIELLEEGYYASSRIMEYMKFLADLGISGNMYEPLMENNERIHRVFGASLKTTRSKKQAATIAM